MKPTTHDTCVDIPELWNPNAAASWSIVFTAAFGAYLHARNWKAIGDAARVRTNVRWMIASLALTFLILVSAVIPDSRVAAVDLVLKLSSLIFLIAWYYSEGKAQIEYVRKQYGEGYSRRHWGKPLWVSIGCQVMLIAVVVVVSTAVLPPGIEEAEQQTRALMINHFSKTPEMKSLRVEKVTLLHKAGNLYVGTVDLSDGQQRSTHNVEVLYDGRSVQFEIKQ